MDSVKVAALLVDKEFDLRLELLAGGTGVDKRIVSSRIQKPGLALAGFLEHIHKDRLQVFGNTELSYLATLPAADQRLRMRNLFHNPIACLVVQGHSNRDIADALGCSLRTVEIHLSAVFRKTGQSSRTKLVMWFYRR